MCDLSSKVTVSIRYSDLLFTLPSQARVLAWPLRSYKRISAAGRRSSGGATAQPVPLRLSYAEDALKTLSLPEGSSYLKPFPFPSAKLWVELVLICTCFSIRGDCPEPAPCSEEGVLLSGKWLKHACRIHMRLNLLMPGKNLTLLMYVQNIRQQGSCLILP
jgi:hypothetical protein